MLALPRRQLDQEFAVLLMRSSYAVADELDFMPMDGFQKEQFIFRQNEWDKYREEVLSLPITRKIIFLTCSNYGM